MSSDTKSQRRLRRWAWVLCAGVVACGGDDGSSADAGFDAAADSGEVADGEVADGEVADGEVADGEVGDGSPSDATMPWPDGSPVPDDASLDGGDFPVADAGLPPAEVTDLRELWELPLGVQPSAVPVRGAIVTYVLAARAPNPAGVFVQNEPTGPAVLVTAPLAPVSVGDVLDFDAVELSDLGGMRLVSSVLGSSARRSPDGAAVVERLHQELSADPSLGDEPAALAGERVSASLTITGFVGALDTSHQGFRVTRAGGSRDDVRLRLPTTLAGLLGLQGATATGCAVEVGPSPMWRVRAASSDILYFSGYEAFHVRVTSCPAPRVLRAAAFATRSVSVSFSRPLRETSVQREDFVVSPVSGGAPLAIRAAVLQEGGADVTLFMTADLPAGVEYRVTVAGVEDAATGVGVAAAPDDRASFRFGVEPMRARMLISEYHLGSSGNAVELANVGPEALNLSGCVLRMFEGDGEAPASVIPLRSGTLAPGGTYVICASGGTFEPGRCDHRVDASSVGFDGDDSLLLSCGGEDVDLFGAVGETAPGGFWRSGEFVMVSASDSLSRVCGSEPSLVGFSVSGVPTDWWSEWQPVDAGEASGLGAHCGVVAAPVLD